MAAAFAGAEKPELVAQDFHERLVWRDLRLDRFAIQAEVDRAPHFLSAV
jgi:hypothetical protein